MKVCFWILYFRRKGETEGVDVEADPTNSISAIDSEEKESKHDDSHRATGDFDLLCDSL